MLQPGSSDKFLMGGFPGGSYPTEEPVHGEICSPTHAKERDQLLPLVTMGQSAATKLLHARILLKAAIMPMGVAGRMGRVPGLWGRLLLPSNACCQTLPLQLATRPNSAVVSDAPATPAASR